jgi:hypothetical protein
LEQAVEEQAGRRRQRLGRPGHEPQPALAQRSASGTPRRPSAAS